MPKKPTPYGTCHRCQSPIEIPGLEASKCSGSCGWVPRPAAGRTLSGNSSGNQQPVAVISFTSKLAPEPTQLELIGQGGER